MIEIKKIDSAHVSAYSYCDMLIQSAFRLEEYRDLGAQRILADTNTLFSAHVILDNEQPSGLLNTWSFSDFIFVEHFVIDAAKRGRGLGQKVMQMVINFTQKPIVLEVEPPVSEINRRRIAFYSSLQFKLCEYEYFQPPYRRGETELLMNLMVYGIDPDFDKLEVLKGTIYRFVYGVNG